MTTRSDPEQAVQFLKAVFRPDDLIVLKPIESWKNPTIGRAESSVIWNAIKYIRLGVSVPSLIDPRQSEWVYLPDEEIKRQLKPQFNVGETEQANIYFGVCPRFGTGGRYELAWQIRRVNCLWVDVDDVTVAEVAERCSAGGLPIASVIVSSGGGVHLYWLLDEPFAIDDVPPKPSAIKTEWSGSKGKREKQQWLIGPDGSKTTYSPATRPELSDNALRIQDTMSGIASVIGGDYTHDLSRIMRLPGTLNRKDERHGRKPRPCVLHRCEPTCRCPLSEFDRLTDRAESRRKRTAIASMKLPKEKKVISGTKALATFDDLINACAAAEIGTRSHADFSLCCAAVEHGWPKNEVWASASQVGKFAERGKQYFDLTWEKAEGHAREKIYDRKKAEVAKKKATAAGLGDKDEDGLTKVVADSITLQHHFAVDAGGRLYHYADGVYKQRGERFIKR